MRAPQSPLPPPLRVRPFRLRRVACFQTLGRDSCLFARSGRVARRGGSHAVVCAAQGYGSRSGGFSWVVRRLKPLIND